MINPNEHLRYVIPELLVNFPIDIQRNIFKDLSETRYSNTKIKILILYTILTYSPLEQQEVQMEVLERCLESQLPIQANLPIFRIFRPKQASKNAGHPWHLDLQYILALAIEKIIDR